MQCSPICPPPKNTARTSNSNGVERSATSWIVHTLPQKKTLKPRLHLWQYSVNIIAMFSISDHVYPLPHRRAFSKLICIGLGLGLGCHFVLCSTVCWSVCPNKSARILVAYFHCLLKLHGEGRLCVFYAVSSFSIMVVGLVCISQNSYLV